MSRRPETSLDGSLYELVARGEKDKYFFKDNVKSVQPFDFRYAAYPAVLPEVRQTVPITDCKFGNMVEFDLDFVGDLLTEVNLLIDLPSWLPPEFAALNNKSLIQDISGYQYGYTNGIGYFLCKRIDILQDNFLLQEISGDALYALSRTRGSYNGLFLDDKVAGVHDGEYINIQRNATPGRLVIKLPFPGCQKGDSGYFPIAAVKQQSFRVRIVLRSLEDIVEATNVVVGLKPKPWGIMFKCIQQDGTVENFRSLDLIKIPKPVLFIETRQIYVSNEVRSKLIKDNHTIPFRRYFENVFTFNDFDYSPLNRQAVAISTKFIDSQFLVERITHFFRTSQILRINQLYNFENDLLGNKFYNTMKLVIAGQDREYEWAPFVWTDVVQHSKEERATNKGVNTMNWSYGWRQEDEIPAGKQPVGGLNFTTAIRPQLNINLRDIKPDPILKQRSCEMRSIAEAWAVYEIKDKKGRFKFAN